MKGQNIIIKRKKKASHGGGHGGSWKVAYADFVTAMMAFFLLMWLLNMTSSSKKLQLSTYFKNLSMFSAMSMYFIGKGKDVVDSNVTSSPREVEDKVAGASPAESEEIQKLKQLLDKLKKEIETAEQDLKLAMPAQAEKLEELLEKLKKEKGNVEEKIKEATAANAAPTESINAEKFKEKLKRDLGEKLKGEIGEKSAEIKDQVLIDVIEGGVRIQIVDKAGKPMFALGSPELMPDAKRILKIITADLLTLRDVKLSIEGHTDALGYSGSKYTNWELSTDRASAARRELEYDGVDPNNLSRVAGFASTEPLIKDNPNDPRNRRITILVYSTNPATVKADIIKKNIKAAPAEIVAPPNKGDNSGFQTDVLKKNIKTAIDKSNAPVDMPKNDVKAAPAANDKANAPIDLLKDDVSNKKKEGKQ